MPLLFGLIGLCCGLLLWPFLIILHLIDLEPFRWPSCGVRVMSLRTPLPAETCARCFRKSVSPASCKGKA